MKENNVPNDVGRHITGHKQPTSLDNYAPLCRKQLKVLSDIAGGQDRDFNKPLAAPTPTSQPLPIQQQPMQLVNATVGNSTGAFSRPENAPPQSFTFQASQVTNYQANQASNVDLLQLLQQCLPNQQQIQGQQPSLPGSFAGCVINGATFNFHFQPK